MTGPFAFCGIALSRQGRRSVHLSTAEGLVADETTLFRVASVSKVVTGALLPPERLGADSGLRHPDWPDLPVTLGMLASHQAGLVDEGGYLVPMGARLRDWLAGQGRAVWGGWRPGTRFHYCNLGYVVLGTALEAAGRFDAQASGWLEARGITGGFNWSSVSAEDRRNRLPTYRRDGARFVPQVDAQIDPGGVIGPDARALDLSGYRPGDNAGVFSPQGGLRTNMDGLLRIAEALGQADYPVLWSPEMGAMADEGGLFDQYSRGVQILRAPPFYPRPLVGHFGNAYGFRGGVWYDTARQLAFAYALNGLEVGDESDALSPDERAIFAAVAAGED